MTYETTTSEFPSELNRIANDHLFQGWKNFYYVRHRWSHRSWEIKRFIFNLSFTSFNVYQFIQYPKNIYKLSYISTIYCNLTPFYPHFIGIIKLQFYLTGTLSLLLYAQQYCHLYFLVFILISSRISKIVSLRTSLTRYLLWQWNIVLIHQSLLFSIIEITDICTWIM